MSDKLLQSIKFPQLPDTYHTLVPNFASEYDPEVQYVPGEFCKYQGQYYYCLSSTTDPAGEFNDTYWQVLNSIEDIIRVTLPDSNYPFIAPYNPDVGYPIGMFCLYNGKACICTQSTPIPAGEFDSNYWSLWAGNFNVLERLLRTQDFLCKYTKIDYDQIRLCDNSELNWEFQDYDGETCSSITCYIPMTSDKDYLISYSNFECYEHLNLPIALFVTPIVSEYPSTELYEISTIRLSKMFDGLQLWNQYVQTPSIPIGINDEIEAFRLTFQSKNIDEETGLPERIPMSFWEHIIPPIFPILNGPLMFWEIKNASTSNSEISKFLEQDYTEVYKSLNQSIINQNIELRDVQSINESNDNYIDSTIMPLDKGNMALQFVGDPDFWSSIDVEVLLYAKFYHPEVDPEIPIIKSASKVLSNSDKTFFIVHDHLLSDSQNFSWDAFKLRFNALSQSEMEYIDSHLIILRKPEVQSDPNPSLKNDFRSVQEFLNIAKSYEKAQVLYELNQPTFLQKLYDNGDVRSVSSNSDFYIDASSFIQLCLRGIDYSQTSYSASGSHNVGYLRSAIENGQYFTYWGLDPYKYTNYRWSVYDDEFESSSSESLYNECGTLAKWMSDMGWQINIAPDASTMNYNFKLSSLQPGDIIFFAEQYAVRESDVETKFPFASELRGYNYKNITHAAICVDVEYSTRTIVGDIAFYDGQYFYTVKVIDVPSILESYLHNEFDYSPNRSMVRFLTNENIYINTDDNFGCYLPAFNTIACICRPQLASTQLTDLEIQAQQLGLHVVPENYAQLNIVKNCRLCSDIEWTPAIDYDRPMPLSENGGINIWYQHPTQYEYVWSTDIMNGVIVDGKFKAGKKYKGMPWTNQPYPGQETYSPMYSGFDINLKPLQFLSIIEDENAPTYIDSTDNKVYPIYGWNEPIDLLRFVFGVASCTEYTNWDVAGPAIYPIAFDFNSVPSSSDPSEDPDFVYEIDPITYPEELKLGSAIFNGSSCAIVTDMIWDQGQVSYVELTEATRYGLTDPDDLDGQCGNLITRKLFTKEELLRKGYIHNPS